MVPYCSDTRLWVGHICLSGLLIPVTPLKVVLALWRGDMSTFTDGARPRAHAPNGMGQLFGQCHLGPAKPDLGSLLTVTELTIE